MNTISIRRARADEHADVAVVVAVREQVLDDGPEGREADPATDDDHVVAGCRFDIPSGTERPPHADHATRGEMREGVRSPRRPTGWCARARRPRASR